MSARDLLRALPVHERPAALQAALDECMRRGTIVAEERPGREPLYHHATPEDREPRPRTMREAYAALPERASDMLSRWSLDVKIVGAARLFTEGASRRAIAEARRG